MTDVRLALCLKCVYPSWLKSRFLRSYGQFVSPPVEPFQAARLGCWF